MKDTQSKAVRQAKQIIDQRFRSNPHDTDYMRLYDVLERLKCYLLQPIIPRERQRQQMVDEVRAALDAVHSPYEED
jgi:hypothetical protein